MDGLFSMPRESFQPWGWTKPSMMAAERLRERHATLVRSHVPPRDRLFFAVLPDAETTGRIAEATQRLRRAHGLKGKLIRPERLHVTLLHVGDEAGLPDGWIEETAERAAGVSMPQFKVGFDRVVSFKQGALVLRGDESLIGLEILQQRVNDLFDDRPRKARPFTPHVTLLYGNRRIEEEAIEPIEWTVKELVLVHSRLGRTEHRHVARIPLG
ncbi:MAG TPA: 2'-5' RNA ligase family protein [Reyranella sp.]|nr:2'-5' RNA ligase family protein [Reyranella sp.]